MRAAVYVRISSDPEGERAGVTRQLEDCVRECERRGWEPVVFEDNDVSAYRGKRRPGYEAMLAAVTGREVGAILAWAPDRFTRHLKELETLIDTVEQAGCQVVTIQAGEWDLATPEGRFHARMLGLLARLEAEKIAARVKRARKAEAEAGEAVKGGRFRAWGYERDNVTVRADEAEEVREAATAVLAGKSITSVARKFAKQPTSVRKALLSPRLIGKRWYDGALVGAAWQPILDDDTWLAVKAVLDGRKREAWGTAPRKYLLTPWVECGVCGGRCAGNGGAGSTPPGYRCVRGCTRRQADLVDDMVAAFVIDRADLVLPAPGVDQKLVSAVRGFEARLADLDAEYLDGTEGMSAAVYARARGVLEKRLAEAEAELAADRTEPVWVDARGSGWDWWAAADLRQRRVEVGKYVAKVVLRPTKKGRGFVSEDVEIVPV